MPSHPSVTGLDHVSLLALNLKRTVQFYVDVLGLQRVDDASGDTDSAPPRVRLGDGRRGFITISQAPEEKPGESGIGTIHHVSLAVASLDALLMWKRWLLDKEVLVYGPYNQQAYRDLVFADPDGVQLEISTLGPGFEVTRDGSDVYSPPREEIAPFRDEEQIEAETWPRPVTEIGPAMAIQGLHHVATVTSSLERADAFYREVLGLQLVRKTIDSDDPEVERWYWGLEGGRPGTLVTAFPIVHGSGRGRAPVGQVGTGVPLHFALDTGPAGALPGWARALTAARLEVTDVLDETGSPAISVKAPDGEGIELVTADSRLLAKE